jgi:hypothetical protein
MDERQEAIRDETLANLETLKEVRREYAALDDPAISLEDMEITLAEIHFGLDTAGLPKGDSK